MSCIDVLNSYANYLSANPGYDTTTDDLASWPQPLVFAGANCTSSMYPAEADWSVQIPSGAITFTPVGSLYIPGGWVVILYYGGTSIQLPIKATDYPLLITDLLSEYGVSGVTEFTATGPVVTAPGGYAVQWRYQMCMNQTSAIVGANHLTSWQPGSEECDSFMDDFCGQYKTTACGTINGTDQPDPLPADKQACVCLVEENCLRATLCEPGSSLASCSTDDAFAEFAPVTCLGRNCSVEGYRWSRMQSQRCSETLCQQIINAVGTNIVLKGGSTIWCGNQSLLVASVTPTPSPTKKGVDAVPTWAWIIIGVAVFVLCVAIPIAVIVYLRNRGPKGPMGQGTMGSDPSGP